MHERVFMVYQLSAEVIKLVRVKSTGRDKREIAGAAALVKLGAKLQVVESETRLPREHLLRLYREVHKKSTPAEMPPIPTDWFMRWQPNTHASVFLNVYEYLTDAGKFDAVEALVSSYQLYRKQLKVLDLPEVLSINHAWRLVKFVDAGVLALKPCSRCEGAFVVHTLDLHELFVCIRCQTPSHVAHGADVQDCARPERLN